ALHTKFSFQILNTPCLVESPMAVATRIVLPTKYAVAATTSGLGSVISESGASGAGPPNQPYTRPASLTVRTSDAMLNSVRYNGDRLGTLNVHWLHALVAATSIVSSAPSSNRDAESTAYEIDIVDPCVASGRLTLSAEATDEHTSSTKNMPGLYSACGAFSAATTAPATQTATTYTRAATGRSFIS